MPGAVPRTSTFALTNATLPYVSAVAELGWQQAISLDHALAAGLTTHHGAITNLAGGQGPRPRGGRSLLAGRLICPLDG